MNLRAICLHGLVLMMAGIGAASGQAYEVKGVLVSSVDDGPIAHAAVSGSADKPCAHAASPSVAHTDAEGRFALPLPCAGTWRLSVSAPGFPAQELEQHGQLSTGIVLNQASPSFSLTFRAVPSSSITGYVLDEASEAVREAKVTLLKAGEEPHSVASTVTDDRGSYEFANLLPGDFLIAVQAQPWYALAAHGPRRFAGNAASVPAPTATDPNLDLAYAITYYPGVTDLESATAIRVTPGANQQADLHLTPVPSVHLIVQHSGGGLPNGSNGRGMVRRILNVPPIQQISPFGESDFHPTSVTLNEDGSMDLGGFAPGSYEVLRPYMDSRDEVQGQIVNVPKDGSHTVDLSSGKPAVEPAPAPLPQLNLNGMAVMGAKPAAGAMLLLVPADPHAQTAIRRQQSNTDGSFSFDHLAAGRYILVAIDHGWQVNWRDAQVLSSYLLHGVPIALTTSTVLKQPVEATAVLP
jgi:hypothetical protein